MRVAALFGVDPAQVASWSGPMMHHALRYADGQKPLGEWLPIALADLCSILAAMAGSKVTRAQVMESWGWADLQPRASDEDLLKWAGHNG